MFKVGLSYRKGFAPLSGLIRWWMGTSYSHTYIEVNDVIYQATGKGVHLLPRAEFEKKNEIVKEYSFAGYDEVLVRMICTMYSGRRYGYLTLVGIFLRDVLGIKLIGADDNRTFICSEFVGTVMELVLEVELGDQNFFTPKDIEEDLEWISYKIHSPK